MSLLVMDTKGRENECKHSWLVIRSDLKLNEGDEAKLVYREHGSGEQSPGEELQENNHHCMVDTGLSKPLWLNKEELVLLQTNKIQQVM